MNRQDFFNAKSVLQARVKQTVDHLAPKPWITRDGEITWRGSEEAVSRLYDWVVAELNAITAVVEEWTGQPGTTTALDPRTQPGDAAGGVTAELANSTRVTWGADSPADR